MPLPLSPPIPTPEQQHQQSLRLMVSARSSAPVPAEPTLLALLGPSSMSKPDPGM